jgi:hypothetical protein
MDVAASPGTLEARVTIPTPGVLAHGVDFILTDQTPAGANTRQLAALNYLVRWYEPTAVNPYWLVCVFTLEGLPVDSGIGNDPDTALLDIAHRLLPPTQ